MENVKLFNEVHKHLNTMLNRVGDLELCCTTTQLCRKILDEAMALTKPVFAIPLTQLAMTELCAKKQHCHATRDDVAFFQHELAIAFINECHLLDTLDKSLCKDLCRLVHMHEVDMDEGDVCVA